MSRKPYITKQERLARLEKELSEEQNPLVEQIVSLVRNGGKVEDFVKVVQPSAPILADFQDTVDKDGVKILAKDQYAIRLATFVGELITDCKKVLSRSDGFYLINVMDLVKSTIKSGKLTFKDYMSALATMADSWSNGTQRSLAAAKSRGRGMGEALAVLRDFAFVDRASAAILGVPYGDAKKPVTLASVVKDAWALLTPDETTPSDQQ
jgi:hypothetical protein